LLWQAVLESTKRIPPFPGLMQASSTPGVLVAWVMIGTVNTSKATPVNPAITLRFIQLVVIRVSFFEAVGLICES
jgi:hypothetical protein